MQRQMKRGLVFTLGLGVVFRELLVPNAQAAYTVLNDNDISRCENAGGQVTLYDAPEAGGGKGFCDTAEDLRCIVKLKDFDAYHDSVGGTCRVWNGEALDWEGGSIAIRGQASPLADSGETSSGDSYDDDDDYYDDLGDPCFLTTACVQNIGLDDGCWELECLRAFRDRHLGGMPGGAEDIAAYYRYAPEIVKRIRNAANPERELARLYALYILPCVALSRLGLHRVTHVWYRRMMHDLAGRYDVSLA